MREREKKSAARWKKSLKCDGKIFIIMKYTIDIYLLVGKNTLGIQIGIKKAGKSGWFDQELYRIALAAEC